MPDPTATLGRKIFHSKQAGPERHCDAPGALPPLPPLPLSCCCRPLINMLSVNDALLLRVNGCALLFSEMRAVNYVVRFLATRSMSPPCAVLVH